MLVDFKLMMAQTLVEEYKNSNNSPYKFNAKELDDETGNYYYGARYYSPKWSFWLSVDPLAEKYPGWSSYNYTLLNPVKYVDPTEMVAEDPPPTYYDTLDEVIITTSTSNSNNTYDYSGFPQWLKNTAFQSTFWTSSYKRTLEDYNNEFGTDYGGHNPGDVYSQGYYQTQYKPKYDKMAVDASAQYAINGKIDYFSVASFGVAPAGLTPVLNAAVDYDSNGFQMIFQKKSYTEVGIDLGTGYLLFYGLDSGTKHIDGIHKDVISSFTHTLMNSSLKKQMK